MANVSRCLLMLRRSLATVSEPNVAKKLTKADIRKSKTKNLFEVAKLLPNGGVGSKMAKTHWRPGSFYKVTEIKLYKAEGHGMAWGIYHQEGIEPGKLQKIGGANRRCWQHITEEAAQSSSTVEEEPQMNVNA
ncbi:unnamed protein product [Sphagnum troendelagicum]|uniref:Uncharacterized protein n=1 Tax=Sphagnum troendelagicum TaxID=128251 RepID=A0ABP0UJ46_9BRYO